MNFLFRILIIIFISVSTTSITRSGEYNSVCAVFKNNQLIVSNSCNAKTLSNEDKTEQDESAIM